MPRARTVKIGGVRYTVASDDVMSGGSTAVSEAVIQEKMEQTLVKEEKAEIKKEDKQRQLILQEMEKIADRLRNAK